MPCILLDSVRNESSVVVTVVTAGLLAYGTDNSSLLDEVVTYETVTESINIVANTVTVNVSTDECGTDMVLVSCKLLVEESLISTPVVCVEVESKLKVNVALEGIHVIAEELRVTPHRTTLIIRIDVECSVVVDLGYILEGTAVSLNLVTCTCDLLILDSCKNVTLTPDESVTGINSITVEGELIVDNTCSGVCEIEIGACENYVIEDSLTAGSSEVCIVASSLCSYSTVIMVNGVTVIIGDLVDLLGKLCGNNELVINVECDGQTVTNNVPSVPGVLVNNTGNLCDLTVDIDVVVTTVEVVTEESANAVITKVDIVTTEILTNVADRHYVELHNEAVVHSTDLTNFGSNDITVVDGITTTGVSVECTVSSIGKIYKRVVCHSATVTGTHLKVYTVVCIIVRKKSFYGHTGSMAERSKIVSLLGSAATVLTNVEVVTGSKTRNCGAVSGIEYPLVLVACSSASVVCNLLSTCVGVEFEVSIVIEQSEGTAALFCTGSSIAEACEVTVDVAVGLGSSTGCDIVVTGEPTDVVEAYVHINSGHKEEVLIKIMGSLFCNKVPSTDGTANRILTLNSVVEVLKVSNQHLYTVQVNSNGSAVVLHGKLIPSVKLEVIAHLSEHVVTCVGVSTGHVEIVDYESLMSKAVTDVPLTKIPVSKREIGKVIGTGSVILYLKVHNHGEVPLTVELVTGIVNTLNKVVVNRDIAIAVLETGAAGNINISTRVANSSIAFHCGCRDDDHRDQHCDSQ